MRGHGLSVAAIGRVLATNGLVIIALQPLAGRLAGRLPRMVPIAAGAALTGLGFGATAWAESAPGYSASIFVWTLGEIAQSASVPAHLAALAPAHRRGAYQGAYQLAWGLAGAAAPVLGSAALARLGSGVLWPACAAAGLVTAALHARFTARHAR
jgi:MFS family permease